MSYSQTRYHKIKLWGGEEIYITPEQRGILEPEWDRAMTAGDTIILKVGDDHSIQSSAVAGFHVTRDELPERMLPEHLRPKQVDVPQISDEQRKKNGAKIRAMRQNLARYGKANPTPEQIKRHDERQKLVDDMNVELRVAKTKKQREKILAKYKTMVEKKSVSKA